jgi:Zn-dependent protease
MGDRQWLCYHRAVVSYFPEYQSSAAHRFLMVLMRTFGIGTFFGVQVRMYWTAAILMPLIFLSWMPQAPVAERLLDALLATGLLFVIIWSHEMGHILAGWRHGIRTDLITLSPLGGLAHMGSPAQSPREELLITLAGPAVHLGWLLVFWPLQWLLPDRVLSIPGWSWCPIAFAVWFVVTTNVAMLLFNLLPIFPLDGGRALRALLSLRVHANRATMWATAIGIGGGIVMVVLAFTRPDLQSAIGLVVGVSCITASLQERQLARHVLIYQLQQREPWETDGDAWKRGAAPSRSERGPGAFTRWRQARAQQKAAAAAAAEAQFEQDVDAALERISQVGMNGLTERERQLLQRASQRRRGAG